MFSGRELRRMPNVGDLVGLILRHDSGGLVAVFPNASGTRVIFQDVEHRAYLYSPIDDQKYAEMALLSV